MDKELVSEIVECLPTERTLFHYCKDRYAPMLLNHFIGDGMEISEVKTSRMAGLLQKPSVRDYLSSIGDGKLTRTRLNDFWVGDVYSFVLTLGQWGGKKPDWYQTTRKGYNLVLQLNFSNQHDAQYRQLARPELNQALNYWNHPIRFGDEVAYARQTLAWSRIDLDFDTGEALIEEIQSDWVRLANYLLYEARRYKNNGQVKLDYYGIRGIVDDVISYCEQVLKPYQDIWSEAMLAATIDFIKSELGINQIYYHSYETGCRLKKTGIRNPPRSLYEKLPRKFCFGKSYYGPEFLDQDKYFKRNYRRIWCPEWYLMKFNG